MDRRNFLAAGTAAAIGGITGNSAQAQCCKKPCGCNGPNMQIGLILYTIRDYLKTPQDIAKTLEKVSKIGYRNIELASVGAISTKELAKILDANGLKAVSAHANFDAMLNDPAKEVDKYKEVGCTHLVCSWMPNRYKRTEDGFLQFAVDCNKAGANLQKEGAVYAYHNHAFEFHRFNGLCGQEILRRHTDPNLVHFEIDTYWVQYGGGSPSRWIRNMFRRCSRVHYKDLVMHEDKHMFAEIGEGNLDWHEVNKACREIGVRYCIVEQDRSLRDPMESIEISYNNMKAMGLI